MDQKKDKFNVEIIHINGYRDVFYDVSFNRIGDHIISYTHNGDKYLVTRDSSGKDKTCIILSKQVISNDNTFNPIIVIGQIRSCEIFIISTIGCLN